MLLKIIHITIALYAAVRSDDLPRTLSSFKRYLTAIEKMRAGFLMPPLFVIIPFAGMEHVYPLYLELCLRRFPA